MKLSERLKAARTGHAPGLPQAGGMRVMNTFLIKEHELNELLDEHTALEAQLARAREALEPFARMYLETQKRYLDHDRAPAYPDDRHAWGFDAVDLTWGDFRKAHDVARSPAPADGRGYREAMIMQEYKRGNLTPLGVANHLRRAGFNLDYATKRANSLTPTPDLPTEARAAKLTEAVFRELGEPEYKLARWSQGAEPWHYWSREAIENAINSVALTLPSSTAQTGEKKSV